MPPSSSPSSAKIQPLSYADRAKKAQSIKSPNAVLTAPTNLTQSLNPDTSNPIPSPLSDVSIRPLNGDSRPSGALASAALSIVAAHTASQNPSPIIAHAFSPRKTTQPQLQPQISSSQNVLQVSRQRTLPPTSPADPLTPRDAPQNGTYRHRKGMSVNGLPADAIDDSFVGRYSRGIPSSNPPPPPSIHDADSWPEVGKTTPPGVNSLLIVSHSGGPRDSNGDGEDIREHANSAPRKSEKTKWVAIPAEELQAAADALQASSRQPHSRHQGHKQGGHSRNNQSSGSASAQGPSRTHSGRNSTSQSVSQSQVHSRTGSVHSSPRQTTRGKRLPNEEPAGGSTRGEANTSALVTGSSSNSFRPPGGESSTGNDHAKSPAAYSVPEANTATSTQGKSDHQPLPSPGSFNMPVFAAQDPTANLLTYPTHPHYPAPEQGQSYTKYKSEQRGPSYPPTWPHQSNKQQLATVPTRASVASQPIAGSMVAGNSAGDGSSQLGKPAGDHHKRTQPVVFGSIGLPGSSKGPSIDNERKASENNEGSTEKRTKTFSVGLFPGEPGPLRARMAKGRKRVDVAPPNTVLDAVSDGGPDARPEAKSQKDESSTTERRIIDLTRPETEMTWEFGTIKTTQAEEDVGDGNEPPPPPPPQRPESSPEPTNIPSMEKTPSNPAGPSHPRIQTAAFDLQYSDQLASPLTILPMAAPFPVQRSATLPTTDAITPLGSEWEVKDYGYGFGYGVAGYGTTNTMQEERIERDQDREKIDKESVDTEKEREKQRDQDKEKEYNGRPRRGSYVGYGYERGGYSGRRGRGLNGGFIGGRGYHARGGRGAYPFQPQRQPPFTVTPPTQFQPLSTHGDNSSAYYPSSRSTLTTYIPTGYEAYPVPPPVPVPPANAPPVPVPLSALSFPLDPTRWYLLGQLEYYLSPQNMAQDFFLRQKMDSRGWISIPLISSFNRVRQLTVDPSLVREVLVLSTVVEVKDDWVRMSGWEQFVLPNAMRSEVEGLDFEEFERSGITDWKKVDEVKAAAKEVEGEIEDGDEEEEEEDVVFVMERESRSWSPERRQV